MPLDVARVHAVQIRGEDRGLVAAGAGADLDDRVAVMERIGRQEQRLERFLRQRNGRLDPRDFGAGFGGHLGVIKRQELARLRELQVHPLEFLGARDHLAEALVLPTEGRHQLGVLDGLGIE